MPWISRLQWPGRTLTLRQHKTCIAFVSTQGVHCFNTSAYTSNLHWIAFYLEISTSTWEAAAGYLPTAIRENAAGSLHLTSKQILVLLLYGNYTAHEHRWPRKENCFWSDCLVGDCFCCLWGCLFLLCIQFAKGRWHSEQKHFYICSTILSFFFRPHKRHREVLTAAR